MPPSLFPTTCTYLCTVQFLGPDLSFLSWSELKYTGPDWAKKIGIDTNTMRHFVESLLSPQKENLQNVWNISRWRILINARGALGLVYRMPEDRGLEGLVSGDNRMCECYDIGWAAKIVRMESIEADMNRVRQVRVVGLQCRSGRGLAYRYVEIHRWSLNMIHQY